MVTATVSAKTEGWPELLQRALDREDFPSALAYLNHLEREEGTQKYRSLKGQIYLLWGRRLLLEGDFDPAGDLLQRARELQPDRPEVYLLLGELMYYRQRLDQAIEFWQRSLELSPAQRDLAERLALVRREKEVEEEMEPVSVANFEIRLPGGETDAGFDRIQEYLLEAASEVGRDFHHYPARTIAVLLYPRREFERLRTTPEGTGGIYDGKIRLPIDDGGIHPEELKRILRHEYTHALLHDRFGKNVPLWLQEGLAQTQEARIYPLDLGPLESALEREDLIPWRNLDENIVAHQSIDRRRLAYLQSYSLAEFLVERYGWGGISRILERISEGEEWIPALENELLRPFPELEKEWRRHLEI